MELVDGDTESPPLISNLEVMQLLEKNIEARNKNNAKKKSNMKRNKHFRHRDWVEEEVHRYLQSTPCVNLDPEKREEFKSKLQGNKKICNTKEGQGETNGQPESSSSMTGFGLTDAEALQIMNMMPSEPVEIHLMIDELQSRMSESQQEEFLATIASYNTADNSSLGGEASQGTGAEDEVAENGYDDNRKPPAVTVKEEIDDSKPTGII
jgi:hypothetical protein